MLRVHWNMVGGFCDILGNIAFERILVYFRSTFAYIELTLEYLGSTLEYVESNWGILGVLQSKLGVFWDNYVEDVGSTQGYATSALAYIAFDSILVYIRSTSGYIESTLGYIGSTFGHSVYKEYFKIY